MEPYRDKFGNIIPDEWFENEPTPGPIQMSPEALKEFDESIEQTLELQNRGPIQPVRKSL